MLIVTDKCENHNVNEASLNIYIDSCTVKAGKYLYTKDLLALEAVGDTPTSHQEHVEGFLPAHTWEPFLKSHPDQAFADFLHRGIHFGFCIGFNSKQQLKPSKGNLRSTKLNEHQVHKYITEEVSSGKLQKCDTHR